MTLKWTHLSILVIACAACRIGADDSTAASDDELIDEGDDTATQCGELGLSCLGPLGLGECVAGECQGRLEPSCTGVGTCEDFCGSVGKVCAELECGGATAYGFSGGSQAEANERCLDAMVADAESLEIGCDQQPSEFAMAWMCCCA